MKAALYIILLPSFLLAGCIDAGEPADGFLGRYQRLLVDGGPQPRGDGGLAPYRPAATTELPPLDIAMDSDHGMKSVRLSLEEAVVHVLVGSTDIGVAAFNPAVARRDVREAAAEFDLLVFAEARRDKRDERTDSTAGGGLSDLVLAEGGLSQKLPTGGEWTLSWALSRTRDDVITRTLQPRYEQAGTVELTQPLLRNAWPQVNLARLRLARVTYRQELAAFRRKVEETVAATYAAYWSLVQARGDVTIQRALVAGTRATLERLQARAELDATSVQIKQTEAALHARQESLLLAEKRVADVEDELARLLSHPELSPVEHVRIEPTTAMAAEPVEMDRQDQLLQALYHSPVLAEAREQIAAADIRLDVAENQALPRLDLTASSRIHGLGTTMHEAGEKIGTLDYVGHTIGLRFEYPLGNRARLAAVDRARLQRMQAITRLQDTADKLAVRVNERLRAARVARERIRVERAAIASAEVQLQAIQDTEEIRGVLTPEFILVKLQAQETLAEARRRELQARQDYNVALVELARETGTLLNLPRVEIALPATKASDGSSGP